MSKKSLSQRAGFTLVELLVVIAIIGVLVGLLLPAVQQARESARRMECTNNTKQIVLAMHTYHDTYERFPAGYLYRHGNGRPNYGWHVAIMPFMELSNLHDTLEPGRIPLKDRYNATATAADIDLLQTIIGGYFCPSDPSEELANAVDFGSTNHFRVGYSSYVGIAGWSNTPNYPVRDLDAGGMLWGNSYRRFRDVTDGTSHTQFIGERDYTNLGSTWVGVGNNNSFGNNATLRSLARAAFIINFDYPAAGQPQNAGKGQSSLHPGGLNIGLVDGSTRFLSETTDRNGVLRPLSLRNDGVTFSID